MSLKRGREKAPQMAIEFIKYSILQNLCKNILSLNVVLIMGYLELYLLVPNVVTFLLF